MTLYRGLRGGPNSTYMSAAFRTGAYFPTYENDFVGFRVATVPEPSALALAAAGVVCLATVELPNGAEMLRLACSLATECGIQGAP